MVLFRMPLASHDQKGCAVPHFNYLDLRNSMVPFMIPAASCVAEVNGVPRLILVH